MCFFSRIQTECSDLEKKLEEEIQALEKKYAELKAPLYAKVQSVENHIEI